MEEQTSWSDEEFNDPTTETDIFLESPDPTDEIEEQTDLISIDLALPDDLQERILAVLPLESVLKACSVCKRWNTMVHSERFVSGFSNFFSQNPWYFMFTGLDGPVGYIYDPTLQKWYSSELPYSIRNDFYSASSGGLVCFMDSDSESEFFVCNPLTKRIDKLSKPTGPKLFGYNALSFSLNGQGHNNTGSTHDSTGPNHGHSGLEREYTGPMRAYNGPAHDYTVAIVRSEGVLETDRWDISIHVYESVTAQWTSAATKTFSGWRAGYDSVICANILYFLIYCIQTETDRHGLLAYDLHNRSSCNDLSVENRIRIRFPLTCGRLMNLQNELVMVGGIGKPDRPGIIKGIGVWVLKGREFEEVSRVPHKFFQGFGELDDVFASSGSGNLIYIQSYGGTALLVFDFKSRQWNWSEKCPVTKKFPLQLFSGFCFEPKLEISS